MISAVILAGGESKRMGQPKMLLPWGSTNVLEQVISTVRGAGVEDIEVISGGARTEVEAICSRQKVRSTFNPGFSSNEMLGSLQSGLRGLPTGTEAALVTLGDQPQIQAETVRAILGEWAKSKAQLIVPSFEKHRGHPWLLGRTLWGEVMAMKAPESPREFLNRHADEITYIEIKSASILQDLDTPEDYRKSRP